MYPFAVRLEQLITNSPEYYSTEDASKFIKSFRDIGFNIEQQAYCDDVGIMREHLLRAVEYFMLAYEEKLKGNNTEVEFHYSSGLMQIAQLHHNLVLHGFAS